MSAAVLPAAQPASRRLLAWAFAVSNGARLLAYLPTLWAIYSSAEATQHSLWTWGTWLAANATMALWLCDRPGARPPHAALVSAGNALMCLAAVVLIVWHRWCGGEGPPCPSTFGVRSAGPWRAAATGR